MEHNKYAEWVQTKLSPQFHSTPDDPTESELRTVIEDFIAIGNKLDIMKKRHFYGRMKGHEQYSDAQVEIRQSEKEFLKESQEEQILHAVMGMATETVEMLEALYAAKWEGQNFDTVNFLEEMGDLEFYRSIPYHNLGWTEKQVRETNYFKLEKRYPEGYTDDSANNRDLDAEREILEKGMNQYIYVAITNFDAFSGIKIPAKFEDLMREIKSTYHEMIDGVFTDYNEYRDFEVECASQARHGSYGTQKYDEFTLEDIFECVDIEKEDLIKLESYKKLKETEVL